MTMSNYLAENKALEKTDYYFWTRFLNKSLLLFGFSLCNSSLENIAYKKLLILSPHDIIWNDMIWSKDICRLLLTLLDPRRARYVQNNQLIFLSYGTDKYKSAIEFIHLIYSKENR